MVVKRVGITFATFTTFAMLRIERAFAILFVLLEFRVIPFRSHTSRVGLEAASGGDAPSLWEIIHDVRVDS
jgi:hypothetical protein